ncbi:disintegrin and metalloproteinase domain-containing protein 2-like [Perognathus longimembris pacificus]|uniref:disintegrin and metalloproteinase domain-containing protein 2-like n=1 Tax=Perognathus longimembris pacificus TaxID=214514 RepID=UPI00201909CE|nr:disintegrin and metalloproteinase domain-containing protein 2-like [Perognathus longimembris pacificus]
MARLLLLLSWGWLGGANNKLQTDCGSERIHVQVTVPVKLQSVYSEGHETHTSYSIMIEDKTYIMQLKQKPFLPNSFRVYSYDGSGIMMPIEEDSKSFCHYQGYLEGHPNSMVILSTCNGLRGILQFGNVSYGIEPLESSLGFEHVIYRLMHKRSSASLYAEKEVELKELTYKVQKVEAQKDLPRYIEMHIVVEKRLYDHMGSDTNIVTEKIFQLIVLTNAIFTSFNLTIILSSLEFWTDENKISTSGNANELLHRFLTWKRSYLVLRPHDVAFLLTYRETSNYIGATIQGKMCDKNFAGGVVLHPRVISLESLAIILVQLLSFGMGISYDDLSKCHCPGVVCIMNPEAVHSSGTKVFSSCSKEDFAVFMASPLSHCLQNRPHLQPSYKEAPVCGNGIVEEGEICDCGTTENCLCPSGCCNAATCTLVAGMECDTGPCCSNCRFRVKGTLCRPALEECDLPEFCNGSSTSCQQNLYVHDGHPCGHNQWICVQGTCRSGQRQCQDLFGQEAGFGSDRCFEEINSRTDISGNCGIEDSGYQACAPNNRKCGKIVCKYHGSEVLKLQDAITVYINASGQICVTLEFPKNHNDWERMWVTEGTVCSAQKVCRNKECVKNSYLNYDCTPQNCNNHGVCNNRKNCHCDTKYLPPECTKTKADWPGGSIDSGNHPPVPVYGKQYFETIYGSRPPRWPFFLIIPFFAILCILIVMLVKVYFQRKHWKSDDYLSDEQPESESETRE